MDAVSGDGRGETVGAAATLLANVCHNLPHAAAAPRAVTITDVARAAGVAPSTVSEPSLVRTG